MLSVRAGGEAPGENAAGQSTLGKIAGQAAAAAARAERMPEIVSMIVRTADQWKFPSKSRPSACVALGEQAVNAATLPLRAIEQLCEVACRALVVSPPVSSAIWFCARLCAHGALCTLWAALCTMRNVSIVYGIHIRLHVSNQQRPSSTQNH